ncbi:hypothetical protein [Streptomyces mirabilis]|uniref:hypothetical protein n=1 Tax=Streptomyces mirabilis TaxID=68239 RepID=UPI0033DFCDAD
MTSWLASTWDQTWPNLLANVIWVPLAWAHHVAMKRHLGRLHEQHRQLIHALIGSKEGP